MKKSLALTLAPLALLLAACSGAEAPAGNIEPTAGPTQQSAAVEKIPGKGNISSDGVDFTTLKPEDLKLTTKSKFEFVSGNGAEGVISFVKNTDPRIADLEKFLKDATGYHREYMIAEVDNRNGDADANMYQVDIFDPEGAEYPFPNVRGMITDAIPTMHSDYSYSLADGSKKLTEKEYEALLARGRALEEAQPWSVAPLGKKTFVLAIEIDEGALPAEITGMTVYAHGGMDRVQAHSPLLSQYKEWKAFQEAGKEWTAFTPEPSDSSAPMD